MSRSRIAASFFLSFLLFAAPALAQTTVASKDSFKDACKAGYTYMIVPTASGVSVREAQRVDCTAKDASGALVNRATRECSQNIGDIYWDCRKGITEGTYKCEHKTCKNGEAISNPATNSSPSPLSPSSQMQLPDVLIQEQGTTALPPLSRQSILDALQQAPSNTGQDSVYRSTAADSFERFMLQAGLAPGGFVPGTGNLDAGTPLSQTPNANEAVQLRGGTLTGTDVNSVKTTGGLITEGTGGSNTFSPPDAFGNHDNAQATPAPCTSGVWTCWAAQTWDNITSGKIFDRAAYGSEVKRQNVTILTVTANGVTEVPSQLFSQNPASEPGSFEAAPQRPDIDTMTPAQIKEIEAQLSFDRGTQAREEEARRIAAIPKSPQTYQNNIFAGLYKALRGAGTEDLTTAWNEAALARSEIERAVPVKPVQVAGLPPIAGTEPRTASVQTQLLPGPEPEPETAQPAAPPPPFTVDPKIDAQVRQAFETQKQNAQSQIRYAEELLERSGTTVSEAAAQGGLYLAKARLDAIVAEEKLYDARTPSPALRSAVEQLQSGGSEGSWAKSFTSFADAAHKMATETGKEMQTTYTNPAEVVGGLADGAIVLGSGFAGGVTEGLRNFATKAGVPGFENDPSRALTDAVDPYKKYTQTAVDTANVVPFGYGIYSAGKMGFGAVVDMMSPAGIVVRDLGVIGELSAPSARVVGTDLVESGAGAGARAAVSDAPLGAVAETSGLKLPVTANIESAGTVPAPAAVSPFDRVTQAIRGIVENPVETPGASPKMPTTANIEPAGGAPAAPSPYAVFDSAVADARAGAAQPAGPSGASSAAEAAPGTAATVNSINATLQSSPGEAGARVLITDLQPLSRGGQAEIYTANVSEAGVTGGPSQSMVVKQFDTSVSTGEITRTATVYNTLVDQGFGGVVPKEYFIDPANKIAVMSNLNTDGRVALSANNLSNELMSPRSLASVPPNLEEVAQSMTQNAVALGQRGIEVNYDAYLLAVDPAGTRAAGFSIGDLSSVKDYGQLQGYLRGSVEYNVKEVQAALDQFGTSWATDQGVRDAFQSQAGGAVRDAFTGATADQSFVDRALVGFGWKDPMAAPEVLSAAETSSAAMSAAEDAATSVLRADPRSAPTLGQEVDKLSMKDWAGGTGATAGILCLGFCPLDTPPPTERQYITVELAPENYSGVPSFTPKTPAGPSEVSMPVNIVVDETPVPAQPVVEKAPAPAERPVIQAQPAVVPPVLTAPPISAESDSALPATQTEGVPQPGTPAFREYMENQEAKIFAEMEIQRKKNEEALAAWDEAQRQRTKEIQDTIARLEKERVDMDLPSPVIVPPNGQPAVGPGTQGVGPLTADEIATGLLPKSGSPGTTRKDLEINFELGSYTLQQDGRNQVAALAQVMSRDEFRNSTFNIVGHTDTIGTAESNLILSRQRAQAIVNMLNRDYGIPLDQMKATGAGQWVLKVPILGNVPANRRVEIVVTPRR